MEEIDLKELFRMFWNKKAQIILIVAIFMMIGVIYTIGFVTPKFSSSTTLVLGSAKGNTTTVDTSSITTTDVTLNSKLVSTYSVIVKSDSVVRKVISNLNIDMDEEVLKKNISVNAVKDTEVIKITVSNENKYNAEKIANEIATVFMEKVKELYKLENVQILDKAEVEEEPSNINHKKDIAIFAAIGLVVSATYVLIVNMLDTTVKTAEEIESTYQIPVLASIPYCDDTIQKGKKGGRR